MDDAALTDLSDSAFGNELDQRIEQVQRAWDALKAANGPTSNAEPQRDRFNGRWHARASLSAAAGLRQTPS